MQFSRSLMLLLALSCTSVAVVAEAAAKQADATQATTAQPGKNEAKNAAQKNDKPAAKKDAKVTKKAGQEKESGWHKFTRSVKQGNKKPACTPAKKSLNQCK